MSIKVSASIKILSGHRAKFYHFFRIVMHNFLKQIGSKSFYRIAVCRI